MRFELIPFTPVDKITINADVSFDGNSVKLIYSLNSKEKIKWPNTDKLTVQDGLWNSTCLEFFLGAKNKSSYLEFNFSPSLYWNAYLLKNYRQHVGSIARRLTPEIQIKNTEQLKILSVQMSLPPEYDFEEKEFNITAIIESHRELTYWAIKHSTPKPDFHDRKCFTKGRS